MKKNLFKIFGLLTILILLFIIYKTDLFISGQTYFERGKNSFLTAVEDDSFDHKKLEDAILNFEMAIKKGNKERELFDKLGSSYSLLNGDHYNAERIYDKAIINYPNDAEFYFFRANCKKEQKKFKSAFLDYEKCINLAQTQKADFLKEAIYNRGAISYKLGDFLKAEKDWKLAQIKTDYKLRTYQDYIQLWK
ncbi:hypothetical protein [Flavobacterium reichenbachii]|uniref:Uncharacterized protein n=1 Tax=Flavobacterium reichenbachii TaxID=362418 RepID=A0A085ZEP4_9FLAO|nr:hypothetical protein [Flavobacterium reichenbachii]KFF02908.1 hypothetical protein IW19_22380 [Flavobacterium reichenbachii]OXB16899.1 hypothetical protein B0A68_05565 [Flavobacterium reichenbachii]